MANTNAPSGLKPIKYLDGAAYDGKHQYYLFSTGDGTATFVGDPVKLAGSSGTAGVIVNGVDVGGMPTIAQAAAGDALIGVVVGFLNDNTNLALKHRAASTWRIAMVADAPNLVYEVQANATTALADVGENADIAVTAGSTATGISAVQLDSTNHGTASAQLRILRFVPRVDNTPGAANAKLEVMINEHAWKVATGV